MTIFLGVMTAIAPLSTDMYLPALPEVQQDFAVSTSLVQMTLTMTTLGMALGQILVGPLSDLFGRRRPLFIGMLVFIGATLGCVLAADIYRFLFFRFFAGFAGASGIVIARAIARDVCVGAELTRFFSVLMMVNGLAPIIAPVIGGPRPRSARTRFWGRVTTRSRPLRPGSATWRPISRVRRISVD